MRWVLGSLLLVWCAAFAVAADVSFVRVWPQWHGAETFDRIGEYFGKPENDWGEIIVRTHPDQRAGMYFLVRVKSTGRLEGARFVLQVIRPDAPEPKTFTFPVSLPARSHVAELGLTDGDWPGGRDAHPVAWKLTLLDAGGEAVASQQSFLWAKPAR